MFNFKCKICKTFRLLFHSFLKMEMLSTLHMNFLQKLGVAGFCINRNFKLPNVDLCRVLLSINFYMYNEGKIECKINE